MMRMNAKEAEQLLINGDPIQLGQILCFFPSQGKQGCLSPDL